MNTTYTNKCNKIAIGLCALAVTTSLMADTYSDGLEENITNTTRTVKTGSGTLTLSGNNSLVGLQTRAGTLKINGGTTTITGGGGTGASAGTFAQEGGTTIVEGGATVNVIGSGYSMSEGGDLMVTNGVFDMTGGSGTGREFLNAFYVGSSTPSCKLIVQDNGVFKAGSLRVSQTETASLADAIGVVLNPGGKIYVDKFWVDGSTRVGFVRLNGGLLYATAIYDSPALSYSISSANVKSYVDAGGFHLVNDAGTFVLNSAFLSGTGENEPDGGMHFICSKTVRLSASGSTFKGGTWLEGNMTLQNFSGSDSAFGAVPSSPTNNIFIKGNVTIFGGNGSDNYTLHRNRNIAIDAGKTVTIGANSSGTGFRIGGEMNVPDGETCTTNTIVKFDGWGGLVVLDTGDGRTNRLDRMQVLKQLEIASGTTVVRSPYVNSPTESGPLFVSGNGSAYADGAGNLKVTGGNLVIEGSDRYVTANKYAQVVVSGGKISALGDYAEYHNGLSSPAKLTVENGGVFEFYRIRLSQSTQSEINVNTGGVLRTAYLTMYGADTGYLNLNGGTIAVYSSPAVTEKDTERFIGGNTSVDNWENVSVRVLAGGARFDTAGYSRRVNKPLVSGVASGETDGGLTKMGGGTLTMTAVNTYNGPTRLEGGTLTFAATDGRPDGDIEFPAAALTNATYPLLWGINIGSFRAGCGLRVTECETLNAKTWQDGWHTVARFNNPIGELPSVTFVRSDGTVQAAGNGWNGWTFRIGDDGLSLQFKHVRGSVFRIR